MAVSKQSLTDNAARMKFITTRVAVALGTAFLAADQDFQDATISDWSSALEGFDISEIQQAFQEHIRESVYPPRPAHIVEIMRRVRLARVPDSGPEGVNVGRRVSIATDWLARHRLLPGWITDWSSDVVPPLLADGVQAARLVEAGFTIPKAEKRKSDGKA